MRPVRFAKCAWILFAVCLGLGLVAALPAPASGVPAGSSSQGTETLQVTHPVLAKALSRLAGTKAGAPIARFIVQHVRRIHFFDPDAARGGHLAHYDAFWNRFTREIGIRDTLSGEATDYLVSLLAHEGTHAMHAAEMGVRLAGVESPGDYARHMIGDEVRAYTAQIEVWKELRAEISGFARIFSADRGDVWLEKVQERLEAGTDHFRWWLDTKLSYGRSYRAYWRKVVELLEKAKRDSVAGSVGEKPEDG